MGCPKTSRRGQQVGFSSLKSQFRQEIPYHGINLMEHPGSELGFCGRQEQLKPLKPFIENMVTSQSLWTNEGRIKVLNFPSGLIGGSWSQQEEGKINPGEGIKIWGIGGFKQHKLQLKIKF